MLLKMGIGGTDLSSLTEKAFAIIKAANQVWGEEEVIITSTWEGTHVAWSRHYSKNALDLRLPKLQLPAEAVKKLRKKLGTGYYIADEGNHIHIGWKGKKS